MRFRATRVIALIGVVILSSPTLALVEPGPPRDAPEQQDGSDLSVNGDVASSESDDYPVVDINQAENN